MITSHDIQGILSGDLLRNERIRKYYPLMLLIVGLIFIYILIGYLSMRQQHRLTDTKREMLDAKFEYMTVSARLVDATKQSRIATELEERGSQLRINNQPPVMIR